MGKSHSRRQIVSRGGHAQVVSVPQSISGLTKKPTGSDETLLCVTVASIALLSTYQNFKLYESSDDGAELLTGTVELATCGSYIFVALLEDVHLLPEPTAKSWITWRPNVRIFRDTGLLVVLSYLILVDINGSFLWLFSFPAMAIVLIIALYRKFTPRIGSGVGNVTSASSDVVEETDRKTTTELNIIVILTLGALFLMDQLPDHVAQGFTISQFLLFLSSTVAALTCMMTKLPLGASLPGVEPASDMLHKTLLLLLLATVHTVAAEWLGEEVLLLCLPELIPVVLWFSFEFELDRKPGSSSFISVDKMLAHKKSIVFGAVVVLVAPLFAYLAISMDEFGLSRLCTTFLLSYGISGILTSYLVFMISHWPREQVAAAGQEGGSVMLMLWVYSLLIAAAGSLLLGCMISLGLDLR